MRPLLVAGTTALLALWLVRTCVRRLGGRLQAGLHQRRKRVDVIVQRGAERGAPLAVVAVHGGAQLRALKPDHVIKIRHQILMMPRMLKTTML